MFDESARSNVEHVSLARRADLVLIAPATANTIGKFAHGLADDLVSATVLATTAPVLVAPAMNAAMWGNPVVQDNVTRLRAKGFEIIEPGYGALACGEAGRGRMAEPAEILALVRRWRSAVGTWKGRRVLVTAGPTREYLDGVRYISNPSSGKMGYAVAREAARCGAEVLLISGPTALPDPFGIKIVRVTTGEEMRKAVLENADWAHVIVKAAAVTDYRPAAPRAGKIKDAQWDLRLDKVGNILEEVAGLAPGGTGRGNGKVVVGFAAEMGDPEAEGSRKLGARGLDLVVANDVSRPEGGFEADTNRATLIYADGRRERLPLLPKTLLAQSILSAVEPLLDHSVPDRGKE